MRSVINSLHVLRLLGFTAAALGLVGPASVYAASATANGTANVVAAISIAKDVGGDLGFGYVVASATAGTAVVGTDDSRSCTSGTTCVSGGTVSAADFTVSGQANYTYAITLPSSATLSDGETAPTTMTVNAFTSSPATTGTLSASGSQALKVGATLSVAASQRADSYTGTFDVTVEYN